MTASEQIEALVRLAEHVDQYMTQGMERDTMQALRTLREGDESVAREEFDRFMYPFRMAETWLQSLLDVIEEIEAT